MVQETYVRSEVNKLLLSNFSLLSFSWKTFTYPRMCNQQD